MTELFLVIAIVAAFFLGMFLGRFSDEEELSKDIIRALSEQVMLQNEEINHYRVFIRGLYKTPHKWLQDAIKEVLGD